MKDLFLRYWRVFGPIVLAIVMWVGIFYNNSLVVGLASCLFVTVPTNLSFLNRRPTLSICLKIYFILIGLLNILTYFFIK